MIHLFIAYNVISYFFKGEEGTPYFVAILSSDAMNSGLAEYRIFGLVMAEYSAYSAAEY